MKQSSSISGLLFCVSFVGIIIIVQFLNGGQCEKVANRSFVIDFDHNTFLKDGKPYQYVSGSLHYFRVPSYYWPDRLEKMKWTGLTAVQFYVPWNVHEPQPDVFDFGLDDLHNNNDLINFIKLCEKYELDVIVRLGPYTCGEFENGGLPWWLLKFWPDIRMRTSDTRFLYRVTKWYAKLMPMLVPFLYKNGGPIISMQVENEYGSRYYCDREYTTFLRDLIRSYVGDDFVLFTVDGAGVDYLKCGFVPGLYPTVDFGCGSKQGIEQCFQAQRAYAPKGPLVNSEFYPGWLDLWGHNHSTVGTAGIIQSMSYMYEMGASFNFYMFEGGTNFGYMNGASGDNEPITTSYDYDAPLSEAGDPTPKLLAIRDCIKNLTSKSSKINFEEKSLKMPSSRSSDLSQSPSATPKLAYGQVPVSLLSSITNLITTLTPKQESIRHAPYPLTFEQLDSPYGFILYETLLNFDMTCSCNITATSINDRGYFMLDGQLVGKMVIKKNNFILTNSSIKIHNRLLQVLVENNGRQCSGFNDPKGLGNLTLDGRLLTNWTMYPLKIENIFEFLRNSTNLARFQQRNSNKVQTTNFVPSIYYGKFQAKLGVEDTFFNPVNWGKGQFFLNNFNVGRYWPSLGPQVTLYVPKIMVKKLNYIVMLELEQPGNCVDSENFTCKISFDDEPILNKTVHSDVPKPKYRKNYLPYMDENE